MRFTFSKTSRRLATAVAAIGVAGVMLAGCAAATPGDGGDGGDKGGSITVIPKSLGNKYFEASDKGAKEAADEIGYTFTEAGPTATGSADQVPFIQTAIQTGQKAICPAPNMAPIATRTPHAGIRSDRNASDSPKARTRTTGAAQAR